MKKILWILFMLFLAHRPNFSWAREILQEIVVQPGDTLWSIANKYLKDPKRWNEIVNYNELPTADPTLALPGTKIKVPIQLIKEEFRNAELIRLVPEVKVKPKNGSDWKSAKPNMTLNYEDSLRTLKGGQAQVKFPSKEIVQINENSYVILKPEKILQEIQLLEGDIRASKAKVILPQGTVIRPKGSYSDYQARVREDNTEVVFVYKGKVDVTAKGKTVTVPEGYGTEVKKFSTPDVPKPLPSFPDFNPAELTSEAPTAPRSQNGQGARSLSAPQINDDPTRKQGKAKAVVSEKILANYHVQLAANEKFEKVIFEDIQPTGKVFDIKKKAIPDGTYFMRVAFIDALGARGSFSSPTQIIKDNVPPLINNLTPEDGAHFEGEEYYCDVIGTVEGAAYISVNDEVIFISATGRFSKFVTLHDGMNVIRIVARDVMGNETIKERKVYYNKR